MNLWKKIKDPWLGLRFLKKIKILNLMSDELYLKIWYRQRIGRKLDLKEPKGFNEKIQWLKLYDRNPDYIKMVDKYEAKKYVSSIIGNQYIIPTIGIYNKFEDINFEEIPNEFVMKCTHDSGGVVICKDKNSFNLNEANKKINKSLKNNYFYEGREWPYKNVKPRIIIEEYMENQDKSELQDYKIMCFNGKVKCSFVCSERNTNGLKVDFFDLDWNKMPFERHYPNSDKKIKKPQNYDLMLKLAEKLSKNIPFVRVDFYEINGKVYFGELTFYPGSGMEEFTPEKWDFELGSWLVLPEKKQ